MCSKVTHRTLNSSLYYLEIIINCNTYFRMMPFFCIHISQGSVATCLRRGGIFKNELCCKFTTEPACEKKLFGNRLIFGEVVGKSLMSCFFDSQCRSRRPGTHERARTYVTADGQPENIMPSVPSIG